MTMISAIRIEIPSREEPFVNFVDRILYKNINHEGHEKYKDIFRYFYSLSVEDAVHTVRWGLADHQGTIRDVIRHSELGVTGSGIACQDNATDMASACAPTIRRRTRQQPK
jgi:hypothetical protein